MKKFWITFLLTSALLSLSGCKFDLVAEIRIDDIKRVSANEDTQLTTLVNLDFEIPYEENCKEYSSQFISLVEEFVIDVYSRGCETREDGIYLLTNFRIPIVQGLEAWENTNVLFGLMVFVSEQGSGVFLMNNLDQYQALTKRFSYEFGENVDISASRFRFIVRTFLTPEVIAAGGVFGNGVPVDGSKEIVLKRRERISIELSNVGSANLGVNGSALVFFHRH